MHCFSIPAKKIKFIRKIRKTFAYQGEVGVVMVTLQFISDGNLSSEQTAKRKLLSLLANRRLYLNVTFLWNFQSFLKLLAS